MATEAGTVAAVVLLEVSVTTAPAGGAFPRRVTVPVTGLPPTTVVVGSTAESTAGFKVRVPLFVALLYLALTLTVVADVTPFEATVNVIDLFG